MEDLSERPRYAESESEENASSQIKNDKGVPAYPFTYIYLLMLVFYIQDVRLFLSSLDSYRMDNTDNLTRILKSILMLLADFSPPLLSPSCLPGNLSGIHGLVLQLSTLAALCLPVFFCTALAKLKAGANEDLCTSALAHCSWFVSMAITQKLTIITASLIHCVKIHDSNLLYLDTSFQCYSPWQIAVIVYTAVWLISAVFVIGFAGGRYFRQSPSLAGSTLCWWLPLVWLAANARRTKCLSKSKKPAESNTIPNGFLAHFGVARDCMNWVAVILLYRVGLAIAYVTVSESLLRVICMAALCFIFLLLQTHLRPTGHTSVVFLLNLSAVLSAALLGVATVQACISMGSRGIAGMMLWTTWTMHVVGVWLPFVTLGLLLLSVVACTLWKFFSIKVWKT